MEIHLVYGELAAKKFVFPIAKSSNKKFLVFYQVANSNIKLKNKLLFALPKWFNLRFLFSRKAIFIIPSIILLFKILRQNKNAVFVSHMTIFSLLPLVIAFFAGIKKRIYFNHGFAYIGSKGIIKYLLFSIEVINFIFASKVISISPSQVKIARQSFLRNLSLIYSTYPGSCCGEDISFLISESKLKQKIKNLHDPSQVIYLSYIGRPHKRKGFPYIIEIFENLTKTMSEKKLILQLIGIDLNSVKEKVVDKEILSSIEAIDFTDNVYYYLQKSIITILPSEREGFGYALLEGAFMGNALASFELIGPDSIIKNAYNGICLPFGTKPKVFANEISKLILNPNHLAYLMKNAWTTAKKYDRKLVLQSARENIN